MGPSHRDAIRCIMIAEDMENDVKKDPPKPPCPASRRRESPLLRGMGSILDGMATIAEGMGSMLDSLSPGRRSPRMRRILEDLDLPDAERLRRDGIRSRGWYDMDPWFGPPDQRRRWPHPVRRGDAKKS